MKKTKLLVLSLLAVSAIGLTSCNEGAQGPKGDTGAQGEKGETGNPGKDGKDGIDGKSFLNGEGVPSDTLGNDGDSYVDTKTFDYYTKENGKWVKKGSIKGDQGEQGEKGEKGDTGAKGDAGAKGEKGDTGSKGSTGSQGDKGDTAWSNTILPTDGGYIVPSVGSATKGTEVTFKVVCDEGNTLKSFKLGDAAQTVGEPTYSNKQFVYEFTATMPDYGFVVSAEFNKGVVAAFDGGYVTKEAVSGTSNYTYTVHQSEGYVFTTLKFDSGDGVTTVSSEEGNLFTYTCGTDYALNVINASFVEESGLDGNAIVNQKTGELFNDLVNAFDSGGGATGGAFRLISDFDYVPPSYEKSDAFAITHNNIIFDLNGKTLNSAYVINLGTGVKTFKITGYGSIVSSVDEGKSVLNIMTGGDNAAVITIDKNVTISSSTASYGISVSNYARKLKWKETSSGSGVYNYDGYEDTQGGVKATVDIQGTIDVKTPTNGVGLGMGVNYQPTKTDPVGSESLHTDLFSGLSAFGDLLGGPAYNVTVNVKESASISATSKAIELSAGQLNINTGATVEATGTDGYALYASNDESGKAAVNVVGSGSAQLSGKVEVNQNVKVTVAEGASIDDSSEQTYTVYKGDHGTVTVSSMTLNSENKFVYDIKPAENYKLAGVKVDGNECADKLSGDKLILDSLPKDIYGITPTFVQVSENTSAVSSKGVAYDTLEAAVTALKNYETEETVITLVKDVEVGAHLEFVNLNKKVTLNLNGNDINMTDLEKETDGATANRIAVRNAELEVTGKGTISTNDVIFNLVGGYKTQMAYYYDSNNKQTDTTTSNYVAFVETKLSIGEGVTTKSNGERAIGIYHTNLVTDKEGTMSDNVADYFKNKLTDRVTVDFKGQDESARELLYVNGDIKKSGYKYKNQTEVEEDSTAHPVINIESKSIKGASYIAGYCDLNVKNSTFYTRGSAFNVKSGALDFEMNTFNNDISNVSVKSPFYVGDTEGALNGNATIWLQDKIEGYAGIDSAKFTDNTFSYTYSKDATTKALQESSYYNVGLYGDDSEGKTIVTPEFYNGTSKVDNPEKYIAKKYSDMRSKFTFTYGADSKKTITAYFLTDVGNSGYSAAKFKEEFGIGNDNADFSNLSEGTYAKINDSKE